MEKNINTPFEFENSTLNGILNNFVNHYNIKEKIFLRHEEIELLLLNLLSANPDEFHKLKSENSDFFLKLLNHLKKSLEKKLGKLLFLTIKNGNYVIIDSWYADWKDWEIESNNRNRQFLLLRSKYFEAKEKVPGIKSIEDFYVFIKALNLQELKTIFGQKEVPIVKQVIKDYLF